MDIRPTIRLFSIVIGTLGLGSAAYAEAAAERVSKSWDRAPVCVALPFGEMTYTSPAGQYVLHVKPFDATDVEPFFPTDAYSALYALSSNGQIVWSGERPYTLKGTVVTDAGFVVGFARGKVGTQSLDPSDRAAHDDLPEYFHFVMIDPSGEEILHEVAPTCFPAIFSHAYPPPRPRPYALQLIVDPDNDRAILHVAEPAEGCGKPPVVSLGSNVWRTYRLSTGQLISRLDEAELIGREARTSDLDHEWIVEAQRVSRTPLLLMHAVLYTHDPERWDARFMLINMMGDRVWSLHVSDDYTALAKTWREHLDARAQRYFANHPAIVRIEDSGCFTLHLVKENRRPRFCVERGEHGAWVVSKQDQVGLQGEAEANAANGE